MTSDDTPITSRKEVNDALRAVLLRAHENGVDVEGGFECRNGSGHPDWDVVVTEVRKQE